MKLSEILRASSDHSLSERAASLEKALALSISVIQDYADDWNSDRPTDVTVILPELKAALERSEETDPCHYCSEEHDHGWCLEQGR